MKIRTLVILYFSLALSPFVSGTEITEPIVILKGTGDFPPFEYVHNGETTGYHVDLISRVAKRIPIKVTFKTIPWKRALSLIETGDADAISFISKTPDREEYAIFLDDNLISTSYTGFIALKGSPGTRIYDGSLESVQGLSVGVQLGFKYGNEFDTADYINKVEFNGADQLYSTLLAKRIDLAFIALSEFKAHQNFGKAENLIFLMPSISESRNYLAFSKGNQVLAQRFAKAMKAFKQSKEHKKLLKRYGLL
ncbi:substrate-binding periplasmic protein [Litoribrevibacter euphylliae]|uniref:Substrate-binding periplasmic protein n=1 Tax=Litoribrevibacter euphylliae TaxID=1834034 RepID=A0ABV7HG93_9GAMM